MLSNTGENRIGRKRSRAQWRALASNMLPAGGAFLLGLLYLGSAAAPAQAAPCTSNHTPQIAPDQEDYFPPTNVLLTASGLECGSAYSLRITTPAAVWPTVTTSTVVTVAAQTADDTGAITFSYALTDDTNGVFAVEMLDSNGLVVATTDFHDSHFRYGHITWVPTGTRTVTFQVNNAFRRSSYTCVGPTGAAAACHAPDGRPGVGDVFLETVGATAFNFGDGITTSTLYYVATAYDASADWVLGRGIVAPADATKQTITHTYTTNGPFTAGISSCCRIAAIVNNSGGSYQVSTTVRFDMADSSPVSGLTPIVQAPVNNPDYQFVLPIADADGDALSCRLATCTEAYATTSCTFPAGMTVDSNCTVHWNTTGKTIGQVYTTQIHITGTRNGVAIDDVAVDFLLQLVATVGQPPVCSLSRFSTAPITSTGNTAALQIAAGNALSFAVTGTDPDSGDVVTLNSSGVPTGATMTPSLPFSGASPQSSTLSWTPALSTIGTSAAVAFTATDRAGQQAQCSVTIEVVSPCPEGTACDDGNACTVGDTCHNNACAPGTPTVCAASDQCHVAGTCDPATGSCSNPSATDGTACDDGNMCTGSDTCQAGTCTGGANVCQVPPPACALTAVIAGPPKQLEITLQESVVGIASVMVTDSRNATVAVPAFAPGDKNPLVLVATKTDQTQSAHIELTIQGADGQVTICDPVVPGSPEDMSAASPPSTTGSAANACSVSLVKRGESFPGLLGLLLGLALFRLRRRTAAREE